MGLSASIVGDYPQSSYFIFGPLVKLRIILFYYSIQKFSFIHF